MVGWWLKIIRDSYIKKEVTHLGNLFLYIAVLFIAGMLLWTNANSCIISVMLLPRNKDMVYSLLKNAINYISQLV